VTTLTAVPPAFGREQTVPRWNQAPPSAKQEPVPTTTTFVPVPLLPNPGGA
jgi:hypothetical protein